MSEVRLVVREAGQDWSGTIHGSDADLAVAALSADPVTLAELKTAATRFVKPDTQWELFGNLTPGARDEPWDAGLVVIDLVARLVIIDSTYSSPELVGSVRYHDQENGATAGLPYHLADAWQLVHHGQAWYGAVNDSGNHRWTPGRFCMVFRCWNSWPGKLWRRFQRGTATGADDANRLYDTLTEVGTVRPDLGLKCEARAHEVKNLLDAPPTTSDGDHLFRTFRSNVHWGSRIQGVHMKVITDGRTDLDAYFKLSGIREYKELTHTPFLVFVLSSNMVEVKIVGNAKKLLEFPDETQVMAQWRGEWRSDFFQFKVGDLRNYVVKHPAEKHHIV